jgi:hypothetical protein
VRLTQGTQRFCNSTDVFRTFAVWARSVGRVTNTLIFVTVRLVGLLLGVSVLILHEYAPSAQAMEEVHSSVINVGVERGLLQLDVRNAPLADVLRVIGEQAGLSVTVRGDINTVVTESFIGVPLDEGITRLVRGHSFALFYAPSPDEAEVELLTGIWVIDASLVGQLRTAEGKPYPVELRAARNPRDPDSYFPDKSKAEDWVSQDLGGPERSIRLRAVEELRRRASRGDETAVSTLAQALAEHTDPFVRRRAATALGLVEGEESRGALKMALRDQYSSVRIRAVRGLKRLGGEMASRSLGEVLIDDPDPLVRRIAARAMAALPISLAAQRALVMAVFDPNESVRQAAVSALAQWEEQSKVKKGM